MNVLYSVVIHCSEKLEDIDMIFHLIFIENALYKRHYCLIVDVYFIGENALYKRPKILEYNVP